MRVVAIGDVGVVDDMMHIGDEAMFEALRDELTARARTSSALSSAPDETAARYGIRSIARIGFTGLDRDASEARLAAVLVGGRRAARAGRRMTPPSAVIDAIADGRRSGGRRRRQPRIDLAAARLRARGPRAASPQRLGRPFVITGQTFGPHLDGRDRELVGGMLRSAALVGVRESASRTLAADLGVEAPARCRRRQLPGRGTSRAPSAPCAGRARQPLAVARRALRGRRPCGRIARLVDAAADAVGGPVVFHAHFGPEHGGIPRGDEVLHDEVRSEMRTPSTVVPTGGSRAAAALARGAGLLITGRYHPAVFAAPAGVPVIGLVTDEYTAVKQRGALAHWGQDAVVPITSGRARRDRPDGIPPRRASSHRRRRLPSDDPSTAAMRRRGGT